MSKTTKSQHRQSNKAKKRCDGDIHIVASEAKEIKIIKKGILLIYQSFFSQKNRDYLIWYNRPNRYYTDVSFSELIHSL